MKKLFIIPLLALVPWTVQGQDLALLETEIKLGKDARRSGSYFGGGFDHTNNQVVAIFNYESKKDGVLFDVYRFDENNKPVEPQLGLNLEGLALQLNYEATDTDEKQGGEAYDGKTALLVRSNFIGRDIVIEKGRLKHEKKLMVKAESMSNPFFHSKAWMVDKLLFQKDNKEKIDLDMMPMGTLVFQGRYEPDLLEKIQEAMDGGASSTTLVGIMADQAKAGVSAAKAGLNAAFMQEGGKAVVVGRVVEKVSIRNPPPYNNNRLRIATVDGTSMTAEEKETHIMPFAFIPAETKGIDNYSKMVALLVPLNSPNTIKEAKQYQMDRENRNRVMVAIINAQGELTDTVEFRSAGNNGKYAIREHGGAVYIPAVVDAGHKRFYNGLVKKPTHFQITKVENGKLSFNRAYDFEEIADKVVVPKDEKFKKLKVRDITWQEHSELENGDLVFFGVDGDYFYAFQVDAKGDLQHLYLTERYDSKGRVVDSRFISTPKGKTLWMTRETPEGVQDVEIDLTTSMSSYNDVFGGGWVTTAVATPRNVKEIKAVTKIAKVDPAQGSMGTQQQVGGKKYVVVGDSGFLMNEAGEMVMIGYDFKKKKKLYAIRLTD